MQNCKVDNTKIFEVTNEMMKLKNSSSYKSKSIKDNMLSKRTGNCHDYEYKVCWEEKVKPKVALY